jgi:hypothetical protein
MFNKFRIGAAGVALVAAMGMAGTANAATANANATATILDSLTLSADSPLNFGTISAQNAGTVAVTAAGGVTCSAGLTCTGTQAAAGLTATGNAGASINISLPSTSTSLSDGATPAHSMTVSGLNLSSTTGTLTGGTYSFTVGGTLNVANGQAAGTYIGQFAVGVTYQ